MDDGSKLRVRTEQAVIPAGSVVLQSFIAKLGKKVKPTFNLCLSSALVRSLRFMFKKLDQLPPISVCDNHIQISEALLIVNSRFAYFQQL